MLTHPQHRQVLVSAYSVFVDEERRLPIREIWQTPDGLEITIETRWPRPPIVDGQRADIELVGSLVGRLGPWAEPTTIPQVETEFAELLESSGFVKSGYLRQPDTPSDLLRAAVRQAQESAVEHVELLKWKDARTEEKPEVEAFDFVWISLQAGRILETSRTAVILAVASSEAFINQIATEKLEIWDDLDDRLAVLSKWQLVTKHLSGGETFDRGSEPFQGFRNTVKLRDRLIHPKPTAERFELGEIIPAIFMRHTDDAAGQSGRDACIAVRGMHFEFARMTGLECPAWVGAVPPAQSDDLAAWQSAAILEGIREDPDFPRNREDDLAIPFPSGSDEQPSASTDASTDNGGALPS